MIKREDITSGDIVVEPIPYIEISNIEITAEKNSHTMVYAKGKINFEDRQSLDTFYRFGTEITIRKGVATILFRGLITELALEECADVLTVTVRGASHTILLDREKKTRPFHNVNETMKGIIQAVTEETSGAMTIIENVCQKQVGQFIMQYEETDWEFIIRLASHCGQNVFPDSGQDYPAFYVGKPSTFVEEEIEDDISYTFSWSDGAEDSVASNIAKLKYTINVNDRHLKLGDCVQFKRAKLYVKSLHKLMDHAVLNNYYELCSREGLDTTLKNNLKLAGKEVTGVVKGVKGDYVNVNILSEAGIEAGGEACWFLYSTVYASSEDSGWYCMPEIGDKVRIRFPDKDEKNAYAISSVSEDHMNDTKSDRMKDSSVRYIRNSQGMEVIWSPNRVSISANGASLIDINQNGTLFLSSNAKITIRSGKDVIMEAGNQIHINGGGGISINCGAKAEINMDESGLIELKGNEIHTN